MGRWQGRSAALVLALTCTGLSSACSGGGSAPAVLPSSTSAVRAPGGTAGSGVAASGDAGSSSAGDPTTSGDPAADPGSAGPAASGGTAHGTGPPGSDAPSGTRPAPSPPPAGTTALPLGPEGSLRGKVVVVDPGHNGANYRHTAQINRRVAIGNATKACDTTGAETNAGYAESAFTFDVSRRLVARLRAAGATVVLTRPDDDGVGPCITERAAIGNRAHADAAISVHGDGGPASGYGFHVIVPRGIGSNDAIVAPSRRLGLAVRDAFRSGTGEVLSTYAGTRTGGLVARDDLGGLNLSAVPKVFIECGNLRNAADARRMTDAAWREQAAASLAVGITSFLAGRS